MLRFRGFLALALLLAPAAARAAEPAMFPLSEELFHRLLADPREIQTSLSYYHRDGSSFADAALGNTWGLLRWSDVNGTGTDVQWNLAGMAYSRFRLSGGVNEFQGADFFVNLPVEARRGPWSGRVMLYHESSHLGDDYIRRTGNTGNRYSIEGLRATASYDFLEHFRGYAGATALLHSIPSRQHGALQFGAEARTSDLGWFAGHPSWVYLAQDFTSHGRSAWNVDSNTELGLYLGFPHVVRALRTHLDYYDGHSQFGQFYSGHEEYLSLGLSFDF
ncbi:MAG TPA: DUF1207 domain-containing protein [Elusimicrobiota bacterium]|jgi:hypothetical protein|nr:DUF1207 domain-containing protein [Elusimicrobiota bacterium]